MKKNKILLVLTRFPYPATDGTRSKILHNVIEGLSRDFDLEFLVVTLDRYTPDQLEYLQRTYGPVHVFKQSKIRAVIKAVAALFSDQPLQTAAYTRTDAQQWLRERAVEYDALYMHTIRTAGYAYVIKTEHRNRILIDFNDAISSNYSVAKKMSSFPKNIFYSIEEKKITRYEKKLLGDFTNFTVITERDREYLLRTISPARIAAINFPCIHFGITVKEVVSFTERTAIYFIGNLDYDPNRDAVQFFLHTIWPSLYKKFPFLHFHIIGKGKPFTIPAGKDRMHVEGYVPDIMPILSQSLALVVPIRFGAGIPTKAIEAMAQEIPVITTPLGALNIQGLVSGKNGIVVDANDAQAWVQAVQLLVSDPALLRSMGKSARELVQDQYELSTIQEKWRLLVKSSILNAIK